MAVIFSREVKPRIHDYVFSTDIEALIIGANSSHLLYWHRRDWGPVVDELDSKP